ncbi:MAG: hypothetical protein ACREOE_15505, partial [Gemmatimonadales bacterium]
MLAWLLPGLALAMGGLRVAEDGGGGAAEAEVTTGDAHFAELLAKHQGGGGDDTETAEEGTTETEGGTETDGAETTETTTETAAATEEKKGGGGVVPLERFEEVNGALKDALKRIEALEKGGKTQTTTTAAEPAWKSKLLAMPSKEGKPGADGKLVPWEDADEYDTAKAQVITQNALIERDGKAAEAKAGDDAKAEETRATEAAQARFHDFQTKHIPDYVKEEGITVDQYNTDLKRTPNIAVMDEPTSKTLSGVIVQHTSNIARFVHRMSEAGTEMLSAEAAKIMAIPPAQRTAALVAWVGRMEGRIDAGLGFD